jgi:restriction system protein
MQKMWMVRADGGALYETFRDQGIAAIGFRRLSERAKKGLSRQELTRLYETAEPAMKRSTAVSGASQVWRFLNEMSLGHFVTTYSPDNRTYLVGTISGEAEYKKESASEGMALVRQVTWKEKEVDRDLLSDRSKSALGPTMTVFVVADLAATELLDAAGIALDTEIVQRVKSQATDELAGAEEIDVLASMESEAVERIKDTINRLDWSDMQELVAGLLRAMGYKTQVSSPGPDRGKDIVASPDGFGFEHPRIVVEVKHRQGPMGSQDIRSFLGGRHKDDRGLYVSTGGFSKDAHYEADRAAVPLSLWTLETLVRTLIDNYEATDAATKRLVPLKRVYIPA